MGRGLSPSPACPCRGMPPDGSKGAVSPIEIGKILRKAPRIRPTVVSSLIIEARSGKSLDAIFKGQFAMTAVCE